MNRLLLTFAVVSSWSSLLLIDSTIKGGVILLLAACVALLLRQDSAATRHLVWLVAVVALLVVPLFSASLPHWRVLPAWAVISSGRMEQVHAMSVESAESMAMKDKNGGDAGESSLLILDDDDFGTTANYQSAVVETTLQPMNVSDFAQKVAPSDVSTTVTAPAVAATPAWRWPDALSVVWLLGLSALMLRLVAARLMLWSGELRSAVIAVSSAASDGSVNGDDVADQSLIAVFEDAVRQLQIRQHVCLMMHPERSIPIVWGLWKFRLLLPDAARDWSIEQQKSVLLHELAHIKRRDALTQLLSQFACAIYWFNPLVWFAAWRLHVERERACDDLVLCHGVAASAYAEHLLNVASRLTSSPWTQACGLAMARRSSLEGRLTAVLSQQRNRHAVASVIVVASLLLGVAVAVPVAMLRASENIVRTDEDDPQSAKLTEDMTKSDDGPDGELASVGKTILPKHKTAVRLLQRWQVLEDRRTPLKNSTIERMRRAIDSWIRQPSAKPAAAEVLALRDWQLDRAEHPVAEVVGWLDRIAAVHPEPIQFAINGEKHVSRSLTAEERSVLNFGPIAENGLQAAWSRSPVKDTYRIGDVVESTLMIRNTTRETVEFQCPYSLNAIVRWEATCDDGRKVDVDQISLRGSTPLVTFHVKPGQVAEIISYGGVTIGETKPRPLTQLKAKAGDRITVRWQVRRPVKMTTGTVSFNVAATGHNPIKPGQQSKSSTPTAGSKLPPDTEKILRWGKTVNGLRAAIMIRDAPDDLMEMMVVVQNVSQADIRIDDTAGQNEFSYSERLDGELQSIKSDKALKAAPWFGNVLLQPRETVAAAIFPPDSKASNGRKIADFMSEIAIKTTNYTMSVEVQLEDVPAGTWKGTLRSGDSTGIQAAAPTLRQGRRLDAATEQRLRWGEPSNGLRAALAIRNSPDDVETPDLFLAVQNVSQTPIHLKDIVAARGQRLLTLFREDLPQSQTRIDQPTMANVLLRPREVAFLEMAPKVVPGSEKRSKGQLLANVLLKIPQEMLIGEMTVTTAPASGWTGKLVTGKTDGAAAKGDPVPKSKTARALFKEWTTNARLNGNIPGGQIRSLAKVTSNFVGYNPTDERTPALAKLLKRMDASRDWTRREVVDLLNDVTDVYDDLPSWVADTSRFSLSDVITTGTPLPKELNNAPWGEAHPSGLRAAWLLDPQAKEYRLNTPLKSRILYHNDGAETVVFRVVSWNQSGSHQAHDATGTKIETRSTSWTTIGQMKAVRLAPGEFTEVIGAGIGIGPNNDAEDWRNTRVGTWIHAKAGDEITFTPDTITASGDDGRQKEFEDSVWWRSLITKRLERDAPTPDDDKERQRILDQAVRDLFGTPATPAEINAFIADRGLDAMKSLAERLAKRAGTKSVFGQLKSGTTTFRVLPIDPDAKNKPYLAVGPGRYQFDSNATLVIVGRGRVMDAKLEFSGEDASAKSYPIKLPDGRGTWAIAWKRNTTTFWIAEKGVLRSIDFSNPKQILEVRIGSEDKLPINKYFMDALRPTYQPD